MSRREFLARLVAVMAQRPYGSLQGTPREPRLTLPAVQKMDAGVTSTLGGLGWPQPMLYAALGGYASNTGVPVTPFTALQAAAVYACIRFISQDIAMLKPFVRRSLPGGGYRREVKHPLVKLFAKPNHRQTRFEFFSYWITSLCLRGNGYVVIERDKFGEAIGLVPVAPDRVTIMLTPEGELWYRVNSQQIGYGVLVPPDDMMHLKNISMDGYVGVSPIAIAQDVIGLALATQQHGGILFRQGGQIGGVLQHPGKLSKEAADRIANSWRETHAGVQNAHKAAILEEGMQFNKIAMTNEDAQFLECVAKGTVITLGDGSRVPVETIGAGTEIMAWKNGGPAICRVARTGRPPAKPMVRLVTHRGRELVCTADHPCLGLRAMRTAGGRRTFDEPEWIKAGDLTEGNYLRVALGHTATDHAVVQRGTAWLLGFLTGNGYIRQGSCSFSTDDSIVAETASAVITERGGSASKSESRPWDYDIHTGGVGRGGSPLRGLFQSTGLEGTHAHTKRVPWEIIRDGPTSWAWFLSGYLDADGTITHSGAKQPMASWSSVNRDLLDDCQHLLALLGIQSAIYLASPEAVRLMPTGQMSPARATWCLCVTGRTMLARLAGVLRPCHSRRAPRLAAFANFGASRYRPANWHYDRIKSVEHLGDGESYGLEIEDAHTHITNGLVTHNTRRFQVIDICRLYGVPPHKLGELDKATLNNIEQQNQQYLDAALKPIAQSIVELFDAHLLFEDERGLLGCQMDFDDMTRGDTLTRYQGYQIGTLNGWLNRNEVRARENMDPIADGTGDEYRVPLNTADPSKPMNIPQTIPHAAAPSDDVPDAAPAQPGPGVADNAPA